MAVSSLKYKKAWDRITNKFVTPNEVNKAEAHDRNRYYSEPFSSYEDKGFVLTLHKQSKEYKSKHGKSIVRQAHFVAIAENTKEYRRETDKKVRAQESLVHKLCKEVIKDIRFIRVNQVNTKILGQDMTLIYEQYIPINIINIEKKDSDTGRVPDITVETTILGKKQELYIEIFYKHEVDESKRKMYNYHNKNCIEVDISELRDNLDLSEKSLKKIIKDKIENKAYWVSNRAKCLIEKDVADKFILDINITNYLRKTEYYNDLLGKNTPDWYYKRLYIFKDNLFDKVTESHPCYFNSDPNKVYTQSTKCTNIGDCLRCSH